MRKVRNLFFLYKNWGCHKQNESINGFIGQVLMNVLALLGGRERKNIMGTAQGSKEILRLKVSRAC